MAQGRRLSTNQGLTASHPRGKFDTVLLKEDDEKMRQRKVYWVSPDKDRGWQVKLEGKTRPLSLPPTKQQAVSYARQVASENEPSQLFIQRADGTIQTEHTYGRDPYPPAG